MRGSALNTQADQMGLTRMAVSIQIQQTISSRSRCPCSLLQCSHLHLAFPLLPAHQNDCDHEHHTRTHHELWTSFSLLAWCIPHAAQREMGVDVEIVPSPATSDAAAVHELQPGLRAANITNHISTEKGNFCSKFKLELGTQCHCSLSSVQNSNCLHVPKN